MVGDPLLRYPRGAAFRCGLEDRADRRLLHTRYRSHIAALVRWKKMYPVESQLTMGTSPQ